MKFFREIQKLRKLVLVFFIFLLYSNNFTKQDLPVHCLAENIEGIWLLTMSNNENDDDVECGHKQPDQNLDHYLSKEEDIFKARHEILIKLEIPNIIKTIDSDENIGTWTMVYDEGFELKFLNNSFFAFCKYKKILNFEAKNTDTEETKGYKSICDKTFVGWFHNTLSNKNWGCFYGERVTLNNINNSDNNNNNLRLNYENIFLNGINQFEYLKSKPLSNIKSNELNALKYKLINENSKDNNSFSYSKDEHRLNNSNSNNINNNDLTYEQFLISIDNSNSIKDNNRNKYLINEIPNLDIYNLLKTDSNDIKQSNFLEVESKIFEPDHKYINEVNNPENKFTWSAKAYDSFKGKNYSHMRRLLGNSFKPIISKNNILASFIETDSNLNEKVRYLI